MNWTAPVAFLAVFLVTFYIVRHADPKVNLRYVDEMMGFLLFGSLLGFVVTVIWWGVTA